MTRSSVCFGLGLIVLIGVTACGIPQETHDIVVRDLDKCKRELADTKNSLQSTEDKRNQLAGEMQDLETKRKEAEEKYQKEVTELRKARSAAEERTRTFRQLLDRLKSMISSGKLNVEMRKGRMIVKMSDKILFDPGKTILKPDGKMALQELAAVLKDIGERDFLVSGHTDNIPIKTEKYRSNWELSASRAVEVVKFLQGEGVDPNHLAAAGFSEYDAVGDNATEDGRKSNRRIEIILMPKIEELPSVDQ